MNFGLRRERTSAEPVLSEAEGLSRSPQPNGSLARSRCSALLRFPRRPHLRFDPGVRERNALFEAHLGLPPQRANARLAEAVP